ncbi:MAG: hypothetical protein KAT34_18885 [Candidatus Aminicenantes bacterium]|nr:hypothetical protein [Candidatus Aminicenantes bacterium]
MKKKILIASLVVILVFSLFIGFSSLYLESAVCYSGVGGKCEGDCCIANFYTCIAGPCTAFIPQK